MTNEQKALVEKNHNLIYYFIKRFDLPIDDYYDILAIGLCKAAINYAKDKFSFSTYAMVVMHNEVKQQYRRNSRNIQACSLDDLLYNNDGEAFTAGEYISNGLSAYDEMIPYNLTSILNTRELNIINLLFLGYKQEDIADRLKITQSYVSRLITKIKRKLEMGGCK